jgi:superfamily II DNA/RNA helicase
MGFIHDVRRVIGNLPKTRQTVFFSATLPYDIQTLAKDILKNPVRIEVTPSATTVEKIAQSLYHVDKHGKFRCCASCCRIRRSSGRSSSRAPSAAPTRSPSSSTRTS